MSARQMCGPTRSRSRPALRRETDRQCGEAAQHDAAVPLGLFDRELDVREPANERADRNLALQPREVRAEARVKAATERHVVACVASAQVELTRVGTPLPRVAIRRSEARHEKRAFVDRLAVEFV